MKLRCACGGSSNALVMEFYCKICKAYKCDACITGCKTDHPDYVLDSRILRQVHRRLAAATK